MADPVLSGPVLRGPVLGGSALGGRALRAGAPVAVSVLIMVITPSGDAPKSAVSPAGPALDPGRHWDRR